MKNSIIFQSLTGFLAASAVLMFDGIAPKVYSTHSVNFKQVSTLNHNSQFFKPKGITGYNQNWSALPAITSNMINNIVKLEPQMIRYPGGSVTHKWDWRAGIVSGRSNTIAHPLPDLQTLVAATNAKVVFDLDIVNSTLADQIEMLDSAKKLGINIEYLELGNELYLKNNYPDIFPTGTEYAQKAATWVAGLKSAFPGVKIAALLNGKSMPAKDTRANQWNQKVLQYFSANGTAIDAYTFHIYVAVGQTFLDRITDFETVKAPIAASLTGKELWITEFGVQKDPTDPDYYSDLEYIADYVQNFADVALSHTLITFDPPGPGAKLDGTGDNFTQEGNYFLYRNALQKVASQDCN